MRRKSVVIWANVSETFFKYMTTIILNHYCSKYCKCYLSMLCIHVLGCLFKVILWPLFNLNSRILSFSFRINLSNVWGSRSLCFLCLSVAVIAGNGTIEFSAFPAFVFKYSGLQSTHWYHFVYAFQHVTFRLCSY